jgi:3-oxoacyl-[acyl-carrier protein] reductase
MKFSLDGHVAVVTGGTRGIGREIVETFVGHGAKVVLNGRSEQKGKQALDEIDRPDDTHFVAGDASCKADMEALVDAAVERFGRLDILVANAGGPPQARALEVTDEALARALNANLVTSIRLVREALPHLRTAGAGRICLITSSAVKQPIPTLALSNTARTGLWGWAKTAAQDLATEGITLNLICPGLHATDRVRRLGFDGPMGDPGDFGRIVAFLCSAPANFISGVALQVDRAATLGLL